MIPANIDCIAILDDLNRAGLSDYKVGLVCDFSRAYVAQIRCGNVKRISLQYGARLYNLWEDTMALPTRALHADPLPATT